jgi:cell division protein FtsQ
MKKYRKPYRIKRKKSILKNRFFWIFILTLIFFLGLFYLICFADFFQVKKIEVLGNKEVSTKNIKNFTQIKIKKKILFFPTKSIFLVNSNELKKEILKSFPQIADLNLKRKFPDELISKIKEREPAAIFCQVNECFFIDKEGIIFKKIREINEYLEIRSLIQKRNLKLGERAVTKEKISKILEIKSKLEDILKIQIKKADLISEKRLNVKTFEGWDIYFNLKKDLDWQLTKLKAVLDEKIPEEKRKDLEYVDLRFGNLAPFKYK